MKENVMLKIEHLSKFFGKRRIINDLNLETYAGEVFGFLGPNGAGKTTVIKTVMGFYNIDGGKITVNGFDREKNYESALAQLGGIVENPEMYKELSGRCNLEMYARLHDGVGKERIDEVVSLVGMENRINEKVKRYSLGMKQRVGLAQALLHKPKVLILDEPTNGLDPVGIKELRDILKRVAHEEGSSVIVSSHLLSEMELMCDRIGIIDNGNLLGVKTISELHEMSSGEASVYILRVAEKQRAIGILSENLGERVAAGEGDGILLRVDENELGGIMNIIVGNSIEFYGISRRESSLEDAFLRIVGGGNTIA